jgi:hypothetical protein
LWPRQLQKLLKLPIYIDIPNHKKSTIVSLYGIILSIKNKEGNLAKQFRAFKSEKRKKELLRQKKQEEKRQKRFKKDIAPVPDAEVEHSEDTVQETTIG